MKITHRWPSSVTLKLNILLGLIMWIFLEKDWLCNRFSNSISNISHHHSTEKNANVRLEQDMNIRFWIWNLDCTLKIFFDEMECGFLEHTFSTLNMDCKLQILLMKWRVTVCYWAWWVFSADINLFWPHWEHNRTCRVETSQVEPILKGAYNQTLGYFPPLYYKLVLFGF